MAIASKLTAIGIIVVSFMVGYLSLYIISNLSAENKKKHIEEMTSQLINFVIFMWIGKITLNFSNFISDPLSILAYPSDSTTFYFAVFILTFLLMYKNKRKKLNLFPFIDSLVHVFLIASFLYEFIEFIMKDNVYAFGYLILLFILIGFYFSLRERMRIKALLMIILSGWSFGVIVLNLFLPFVTVFGYIMEPWFIGVFFIIVVFSLLYKSEERNA